MRLFFYNISRKSNGFQRKIDPNALDLIIFKNTRLKKTRTFHDQILNFHFKEFVLTIALFIGLFWASMNQFFNDPFYLSRMIWDVYIDIPTSQNAVNLELRDYYNTVILTHNGELFFMDSKIENNDEAYEIHEYYFMGSNMNISIYIDENTEMRYVYRLLDGLQKAGITNIYFMTKKE